MILSLHHGFLYLAMPKTATTSVEQVLAPHGDLVLTRQVHHKHIDCKTFEKRYEALAANGIDLGALVRFGMVRNPVDWTISWFNFRSRPQLRDGNREQRKKYTGDIAFEEFVEELGSSAPRPFARLRRQHQFFSMSDGSLGVDFLARHEKLLEDLTRLEPVLGLEIAATVAGMRRNVSAAKRFGNLTSDTEHRIRRILAPDFELHERAAQINDEYLSTKPCARSQQSFPILLRNAPIDVAETMLNKTRARYRVPLERFHSIRERAAGFFRTGN